MHEEILQRLRTAAFNGDLFLFQELLPTLRLSEATLRAELSECLLIAVQYKRIETTQFLVHHGADVMHTTSAGTRAIHLAAQNGSASLLKVIIAAGSAINVADDSGCVALHYVLKLNDEASVMYLIKEGAQLTRPKERSTGECPMHYAARFGSTANIMRKMIQKGGDVNAVAPVTKCTPLHLAVKGRRFAIAELLCRSGAHLDVVDKEGDTPLLAAVAMSSHEMVRLLLSSGASPCVQNSKSLAPLHVICSKRPSAVRLQIAQMLVEYGASIETLDKRGATPLHHAAMAGNVQMCEFLLDCGASIDAVEHFTGNTVLNAAIFCNKLDCARMLLKRGADILIADSVLMTPLHKTQMAPTTSESKYLLTDELLQRQARLNAQGLHGFSPLDSCVYHLAIGEVTSKTLRRLVEAGAHLKQNTDQTRAMRNSPLCWMTWHGSLKLARYLVNCGWDLSSERWINMPGKDQATNEFLSWMRSVASEPRHLKMLCRNAVRQQMNSSANDTDIGPLIQRLPVPPIIARYLSLVDECDSCFM